MTLATLQWIGFGLIVCLLAGCGTPTTPAPTAQPTATPFPVITRESVLMPTHPPLPEPTFTLPTAPPIEWSATVQAQVTEIACISTKPDDWLWYEVQAGDTLENLAQRTGITAAKLALVNCLEENAVIAEQTMIVIPDQ